MIQVSPYRTYRPRRLRGSAGLRVLARETGWSIRHLIAPLFVQSGSRKTQVPSMPGQFRYPAAETAKEAKALYKLGIRAVLIFGIPPRKNPKGTGAYAANGIVQQAVRAIKKAVPDLVVITDVCLCEYTAHGHCGVLNPASGSGKRFPGVDNDATLPLLAQTAVTHARAGADVVAPSAMMDGQVRAIREALDGEGFTRTAIMSYSAKYASGLYGPFRDAAGSAPRSGDRKGYQMDPANAEEALREAALDIQEGADWVMVKPALTSLDILHRIKQTFHWPTVAYQVSGEYALVKAAGEKGWIDEEQTASELITVIRRAGADLVITYYAKDIAKWIRARRQK